MGKQTDVFVIGGGPAGLAAAIAARQKGFQVTVADGAQPPIDKACGEGLMPETLLALRELGIVIREQDGFAFRGICFVESESRVESTFSNGQGIGVRRTVLHEKLVARAQASGVTLLWNVPVTRIAPGGVIAGGRLVRARWIIGADGSGSRVRRWSQLDEHKCKDVRYAWRRHYRVAPWADRVEIHWGDELQAYITPVARDEVGVVMISRSPKMSFASSLRAFPDLAARIGDSAMADKERGAMTAMHSLRRVVRGRLALIGDASGGVDAITGEGLSLGFCQAIALANALDAGDLSSYETAHRRLARRPTWMGRTMLLLGRHTALRHRALRALAGRPELFSRLLAIHAGETSPGHLMETGALLGWSLLSA